MHPTDAVLLALHEFLSEQIEKWEKLKLEPGYKLNAIARLDAFEEVRNFLSEIPAPLSAGMTIEFKSPDFVEFESLGEKPDQLTCYEPSDSSH